MPDLLDALVKDAIKTIKEGYYETSRKITHTHLSFRKAILSCRKAAVISEIKFKSPSTGVLRGNRDLRRISREMEEGGAIAISILTEPKHFKGDIRYVAEVREQVKVPILMKDIVLSPLQIEAASKTGADAVLLIQTLFDRGYCEKDVQEMIGDSHSRGLEVLLEVHTRKEFISVMKTEADMMGINNRDLKTLEVDLETTKRLLSPHDAERKVIVSESGINRPEDIRMLRKYGAQAFLVGTTVMKADSIKMKIKELVEAL
jgi:indole-3-glycerol phosphate synthase